MLLNRPVLAVAAALPIAFSAARAADLPRKAPELTIAMSSGSALKLSQYKGKVVAVCFILTTCPHCQKTVGILTKLQNEYGPRGFQVVAAAIEQGAGFNVPHFIQTYSPSFPVGYLSDPSFSLEFMQHPPTVMPQMPMLAFVDRQGMIRDQHEGNDQKFFNEQQEENLRTQIELLLKASAAPAKNSTVKKSAAPKKQG